MDWEQRCLRLCAAVLTVAVLLRLGSRGAFLPIGQALEDPRLASFLVYLQTGRVVRLTTEVQALPLTDLTDQTEPTEPPAPTVPQVPAEEPVFTAADADLIGVTNNSSLSPDIESLLTRKLDWDLTGDEPKVLILHTHTTESYTQTETDTYEESSAYRTLDPGSNMLHLGDLIEDMLVDAGIGVIHDEQFHDYPSYNGSYSHAAASTQEYLEQYPSIELVLDLHRDAADMDYGQLVTQCTVDGQTSAQLMMVVGAGTGRLTRPDWECNLSLALKLQVLLERENPGICRDLHLTYQRYNQHLGGRALLIEIGAAGNTLDEASIAAKELARAIIQLAQGSQSPD